MEEYLRTTKLAIDKGLDSAGCVHVVIGNEACDLDSAVCAVVYAYFLYTTQGSPDCLFLPVLNIPRKQYRLRTETVYLLGQAGITSDLLTFTDDLDLVSLTPRLEVTLVDHHVLPSSLAALDGCVKTVIDHRPVERQWPDSTQTTIAPVGSCCTLVTETMLDSEGFTLDNMTATLLVGTILTDTINLNPAAGKTTPRDEAAIGKLQEVLPTTDLQDLYDNIHRAKSDLSGLTSLELLQKDLKMVSGSTITIAMSSIMMSMKDLLAKEDLSSSLQEFVNVNPVAAVVIMTLCTPAGQPQRQLAVYSTNRIYRQQICEVLMVSGLLQLEAGDFETVDDIVVYNQGNVQASRKKVMPILKAFLNGERTPEEDSRVCEQTDSDASLVDFSDSGKGESQGDSDRPGHNDPGIDLLSPDPFDILDLSPQQSEIKEHEVKGVLSPDPFNILDLSPQQTDSTGQEPVTDVLSSDPFDALDFSPVKSDITQASENDRAADNVLSPNVLDISPLQSANSSSGVNESERAADVLSSDLISPSENSENSSSPEPVISPAVPNSELLSLGNNTATSSAGDQNLNAFDIFSLNQNQDSLGDISKPQFIDNLISTECDDLELTEADIVHPGSNFDILGLDSPMDMSSGQNSGQGSKVSSYPVTPPNSFMESAFADLSKEHNLPSFNSSEMVERIRVKKASLEGVTNFDECDMSEMPTGGDSIFTPQNSYSESNMNKYVKETELPSFHNSEMVQRIRQKRASLEQAVNDEAQEEIEDRFPWTPHNSYVESSMDRFGQENLPSFNNAEMVRKIQEKRESLPSLDENENESGASGCETTQVTSTPFTPQNSYVEGRVNSQEGTDLNQVVDRLSGAAHTDRSSPENLYPDNVVSDHIADDILSDSDDDTENVVARGISQEMFAGLNGDKLDSVVNSEGKLDSRVNGEGLDPEDEMSESAINEVAFALANDLIQNALETFNLEQQTKMVDTSKETSVTKESEESVKSDINSITVETEYLPEMDPLHGNMDIVENASLETDAVREVAESSSFRKISGQVSQDSQEEILRNLQPELEVLRQEEEEVKEVVNVDQSQKEGEKSAGEAQNQKEGEGEEKKVSALGRKHITIDPDLSLPLTEEPEVQDTDPERQENTEPEVEKTDMEVEKTEVADQESTVLRKKVQVKDQEKLRFSVSSDVEESPGTKKKVIHVKDEEQLRFSLSSDVDEDDTPADGPLAPNQHHYSGTADEQKEVFITTAGRISIGVEKGASKGDNSYSEEVGDTPTCVHGADTLVPVHGSLPEDDVFQPVSPAPESCDVSTAPESCDVSSPTLTVSSTSSSTPQSPVIPPKETGVGRGPSGEMKRERQEEQDPAGSGGRSKKKIVPDLTLLSDEEGEGLGSHDNSDFQLETPDDDDSDLAELEWENDTPVLSASDAEPIPEYTEQEEKEDARHWKTVTVGDKQFRIDLRVIEPYKKVLSHGGYYGDGLNAIILFSGCYLPDRRRKDYNYVMDNLFHYVVNTLEQLVAEGYMIVYFHGATPRRQMPSLSWLKKCYQMIDRRLKKNLKALLLVHPTLWLRTVVMMTRPFISAKFSSKLRFVRTLQELSRMVPMDHVYVPEQVQSYDANLQSGHPPSSPSSPHPTSP